MESNILYAFNAIAPLLVVGAIIASFIYTRSKHDFQQKQREADLAKVHSLEIELNKKTERVYQKIQHIEDIERERAKSVDSSLKDIKDVLSLILAKVGE